MARSLGARASADPQSACRPERHRTKVASLGVSPERPFERRLRLGWCGRDGFAEFVALDRRHELAAAFEQPLAGDQ